MDYPEAFNAQETAERSAKTLGRVLVLDLVLRNEDRLRCKQLGWRGNDGNLMATKKQILGTRPCKERSSRPLLPRRGSGTPNSKQQQQQQLQQQQYGFRKQLRSQFDSTSGRGGGGASPSSGASPGAARAAAPEGSIKPGGRQSTRTEIESSSKTPQLCIVAIDSGVPRRPPSSKVEKDKTEFPKFVELLLNDEAVASQILQEISSDRLGRLPPPPSPSSDAVPRSERPLKTQGIDQKKVVKAFQEGFRAGAHDMQDLRMFLLKLFRKLSQLLKEFVTYMASIEDDKLRDDSPSRLASGRRNSRSSESPTTTVEVQKSLEGLSVEPVEQPGDSMGANGQRRSDSRQTPRTPPSQLDSGGGDQSESSSVGRSFTPKTPPLQQDSSPDQRESSVGRSSSSSRRSSSLRGKAGESWSGKLMESKVKSPQFSSRLTLKLKHVNKSAKVLLLLLGHLS